MTNEANVKMDPFELINAPSLAFPTKNSLFGVCTKLPLDEQRQAIDRLVEHGFSNLEKLSSRGSFERWQTTCSYPLPDPHDIAIVIEQEDGLVDNVFCTVASSAPSGSDSRKDARLLTSMLDQTLGMPSLALAPESPFPIDAIEPTIFVGFFWPKEKSFPVRTAVETEQFFNAIKALNCDGLCAIVGAIRGSFYANVHLIDTTFFDNFNVNPMLNLLKR